MKNEIEKRDIAIIGGGPAGLSAAIFTQLDGWNTLILERDWVGGQGTISSIVANYAGFPPGDGTILMKNMETQVTSLPPAGVANEMSDLKNERVVEIDSDELIVTTEMNRYKSKAIILAMGSKMSKLGIPGEENFSQKGVSYYAVRDMEKFAGKKVLVVGGGNSTITSALVAKKAKAGEVSLIHRKKAMRAYPAKLKKLGMEGIGIRYNTELKEILGEDKVERAVLVNNVTGEEEETPVDWIVISVGTEPDTELARGIGLEMDDGFLKVDKDLQTDKEGIFACGDLIRGPRRIITAAAQGAFAGMNVSEYLAIEMVRSGELFKGAKNGKYAEEYLELLK